MRQVITERAISKGSDQTDIAAVGLDMRSEESRKVQRGIAVRRISSDVPRKQHARGHVGVEQPWDADVNAPADDTGDPYASVGVESNRGVRRDDNVGAYGSKFTGDVDPCSSAGGKLDVEYPNLSFHSKIVSDFRVQARQIERWRHVFVVQLNAENERAEGARGLWICKPILIHRPAVALRRGFYAQNIHVLPEEHCVAAQGHVEASGVVKVCVVVSQVPAHPPVGIPVAAFIHVALLIKGGIVRRRRYSHEVVMGRAVAMATRGFGCRGDNPVRRKLTVFHLVEVGGNNSARLRCLSSATGGGRRSNGRIGAVRNSRGNTSIEVAPERGHGGK